MINLVKEKKSNGTAKVNGKFKKNGNGNVWALDYIDLLPVPVVVMDKEFNVRFTNRAGAEILSCSKNECMGKKCYDLFKFPGCNTEKCQGRKVFEEGNSVSGEVVIKNPKGDEYCRCYTIPIRDNAGEVIGVLEYFVDAKRELIFAMEAGNTFMSQLSEKTRNKRIDYKQYDGVLRRVGKGINQLLDNVHLNIDRQHENIVKIVNGDKDIAYWEVNDAGRNAQETFNKCVDTLNDLRKEVETLTQAAAEGRFGVRGDPSKFQGMWAEMIQGFNYVLDSVVGPLNEVAGVLGEQANYDLTVNVTGEFKGDLAALKLAANRALRHQVEAMQKLKQVSNDLAQSSEQLIQMSEQANQATGQIANASQQVARGASDQATAMQDTMKALEQLTRAIDQIARGAQEQARLIEKNVNMVSQVSTAIAQVSGGTVTMTGSAKSASDTAERGAEMVQKTIKGMEEIKTTIDAAAERMGELGTRSREIGKIVAAINDIADQTNLLALNAAIEAARAGEQGRGFAVVADEVRKLAERASASTKEIAELIGGIQNGVAQTITAMEKGTEQIASGYELANRAGGSLEEILKRSREMGEQVEQISGATQQLSAMSTEMVKLSDNISAIVEENTAATEEMAATAKTVSRSVEEVAGVAEENSAATQEVSAAAEEIGAQVQEVVSSGGALSKMADEFKQLVGKYKLVDSGQDSKRNN
ncbi:MAG: methyl-accepting chemotaxis protein [Dehalococcoidia bacterium]|nr:methyl-accepting chemotaxis protein [Dehalococcoidia bacterium]